MTHNNTVNLYTYQIFGLTISSMLELPELVTTDCQEPDVTIEFSSKAQGQNLGPEMNYSYDQTTATFHLRIAKVGKYQIVNGRKIIVDPDPGSHPDQIRLFLLGTCMGVLLHQRGITPLHGSSIATATGCAIFLGPAGIGKSTLVTALSQHGRSILADDICALSRSEHGDIVVSPGYPQVKLCGDVTEALHLPSSALIQPTPRFSKFKLQIGDEFQKDPLKLEKVFILQQGDQEKSTVEPLGGMSKFVALSTNIYRGNLAHIMGMERQSFQLIAILCNAISVFRIIRPHPITHLPDMVSKIEQLLSQ